LWREVELTVGMQVLSHWEEIGAQTLGTDVIETLGDDAQSAVYLRTVGGATFSAPRLACQ
jgi:hypothetical protein